MSSNRHRTSKIILDAASVDKDGDLLEIPDVATVLTLGFRVDASLNTLSANIKLFAGCDPVFDDPASMGVLVDDAILSVTPYPGTVAYTPVNGGANWVITNAAVGVTRWVVQLYNPPPVLLAKYDFTSGGGTVRVRVKAVW